MKAEIIIAAYEFIHDSAKKAYDAFFEARMKNEGQRLHLSEEERAEIDALHADMVFSNRNAFPLYKYIEDQATKRFWDSNDDILQLLAPLNKA